MSPVSSSRPTRRRAAAEATAHEPAAGRKAGWRAHLSSGLVFGLVGMLTGISGIVLAYRSEHEQGVIRFVAYPTAGTTDLTQAGLGVRVQLINQSLRPVIVRSVSLWRGSDRIADGTGYLADTRVLDRAGADPAGVVADRLNLPLDLDARQGRDVAFLLDVWTPLVAAAPADVAVARTRLNGLLSLLSRPSSALDPPLQLEVQLAPGGIRRYTLSGSTSRAPAAAAVQSIGEAPWVVTALTRGPVLVGLWLQRPGAGAQQLGLVRLDVWGQQSLLHRALVRPLSGTQATLFPLPALPRGGYIASFTAGGQVVASQSFVVPWPREPCARRLYDGTRDPVWCYPAAERTSAAARSSARRALRSSPAR